jgi:pimeloyl-ACP methyl ester carboxylesterase
MNTESSRYVHLPDGRIVEVRTWGPDDGEPLVFHHGTPGAGLPYPPWALVAESRGLRTIMYSRPGYGDSTPQPGRMVIDAATDVAHILDALGANTFRTIGWSGGGPHALACAAALPQRCLATAVIAGVAPYPAEGLDWMAGMGKENVEEFGLSMQGAQALTPFLESFANDMRSAGPADLASPLGDLLPNIDKTYLTGDFADYLYESFRIGLSHGIQGQLEDDLAFVKDWGFDLRDVPSAAIWQGSEDRMVPYAHGVWLADHIPGARRHLYDGEGHLSIAIGMFERVVDDLLVDRG